MSISLARRLGSLLVVAGLLTALAPTASAAKVTFALGVCRTGDDLQMTMSWNGALADTASFGIGTRHPRGGLGFIDPIDPPATSGTIQELIGALVDGNEVDTAGAGVYLTDGGATTRQTQVASKTLNRPNGGWPACA